MKRTMTATSLILATALAAPLVAQEFADVDADGDAMASFPELQEAFGEGMTEDLFTAMDANGDGAIDEAELETARGAGLLPASDG